MKLVYEGVEDDSDLFALPDPKTGLFRLDAVDEFLLEQTNRTRVLEKLTTFGPAKQAIVHIVGHASFSILHYHRYLVPR